jgi:hypothetical protein
VHHQPRVISSASLTSARPIAIRAAAGEGFSNNVAISSFEKSSSQRATISSRLWFQLFERRLIPLQRFSSDCQLDRGRVVGDVLVLDQLLCGPASCAAHLIANTIEHDLPKETLKSSFVARLELLERDDGAVEDLLGEIVGVQQASGMGRQAAMRPPSHSGQVACEQLFSGVLISLLGTQQEGKRGDSRTIGCLARRR